MISRGGLAHNKSIPYLFLFLDGARGSGQQVTRMVRGVCVGATACGEGNKDGLFRGKCETALRLVLLEGANVMWPVWQCLYYRCVGFLLRIISTDCM